MQLVATSKLKRATDAIVQMRPYAKQLSSMLSNIVAATEGDVSIELAKVRPEIKNVLVVVITSDKGLCGGFNSNVIKQARKAVDEKYAEQRTAGNLSIMTFGKKGNDFFKKYKDCNIIDEHIDVFKNLSFENASVGINDIMEGYTNGKFDEVMVAYAEFKNPVVQEFHLKQFLPIESSAAGDLGENKGGGKKSDYIFDPNKEQLINELVPKILKTQLYSYLLDSNASEHGARMTAMGNATENAGEMLRQLKISYNKERQAAITTELTEIVSGAAALEG
ncbi:UNVERIFIED_CONTAM: hypothetical protein GTU68_017520 [Idotea baltica]|nr:hypothetical protein [Idotea baltica]